jgi:tRNA pseudouridine55 synthase
MPIRTANRVKSPKILTDLRESGLVVVDKPSGWTSHQVVARCRRLYGTRKVGHAGTLDPMATGVLLVGVNRATRLLGYLAGHDKSYSATIRLGQDTVTDDAEGEIIQARGAVGLGETDVRSAITDFIGVISQVPSAVSAIKVDGKRSYARVRAGEHVELAAREVTVSRFDVIAVRTALSGELPILDVDVIVDCTSGTYIRALARDLGAKLATGGHLTALRRTRVGGFELSSATLDADGLAGDAGPALLGMAEVAQQSFPTVEVDDVAARDIGFGRSLALPLADDPTAMLYGGELLALYRPGADGMAVPIAVLSLR